MIKRIVFCLTFIFSITLFVSCSQSNTNLQNNNGGNKLTINDIKKKYINENITNITTFKSNYVLVELERKGFANKFAFYNLKTGDMDELPSMPEFTKLLKIIDENNISLLATGKNSEVNTINFPYILNFHRDKENINNNLDFVVTKDNYFLDISQNINIGDDSKYALISSIKQDTDGITIYFMPIPSREVDFKAGHNSIPYTSISYSKIKNQLVLNHKNSKIEKKIIPSEVSNNDYYLSIEQSQEESNSKIVISLKNKTTKYSVVIKEQSSDSTYEKIIFK